MKTKTNELIGAALDWAVAKCEGVEYRNNWEIQYMPDGEVDVFVFHCTADDAAHAVVQCEDYSPNCTVYDYAELDPYCPSTNWSQGGPIIERETISVGYERYSASGGVLWDAVKKASHEDTVLWMEYGPTPLIAAMRCYVASKLGNKVEIPEELK